MRVWRKLHSKITYSPDLVSVSDSAVTMLTLLIAAQDDSGFYPWDDVSLRRLIAARPRWNLPDATAHAEELVGAGIAAWEHDGILLVNGEKLNGKLRRDVEPMLYPRQRPVNATSTPRQQDVAQDKSKRRLREEKTPPLPPSPTASQEKKVKTPQKKVVLEIDQDFRGKMRAKFGGVLAHDLVDELIDLALAHTAAGKYSRVDLYVQNWLRREADRRRAEGGKDGRSRDADTREDREAQGVSPFAKFGGVEQAG